MFIVLWYLHCSCDGKCHVTMLFLTLIVTSGLGFVYFREGILFALGNPLLDISAEVTEVFLKR